MSEAAVAADRDARARGRRRAPTSTRCSRGSSPPRRMPRCSRRSPARRRWRRPRPPAAPTPRPRSPAAWDALRAASARDGRRRGARGVPDALRRRRPQRGEPVRVALPRTAVGAAAGGDPRRRSPSSASRGAPTSSEFEDHLAVLFETMRMLIAGDGERPPARLAEQRDVLRAASRAVGIRLLHCNSGMSCCQLLPPRCTIHAVASWRSNVTRSPSTETIALTSRDSLRRLACATPSLANIPAAPDSGAAIPTPPILQAPPLPARARRGRRRRRRCRAAGALPRPRRSRAATGEPIGRALSRNRARARLLPHDQTLGSPGGGRIMLLTKTSDSVAAAGPRLRRLAGSSAPDDGSAHVPEALGPRRRRRRVREPAALRRDRQGRRRRRTATPTKVEVKRTVCTHCSVGCAVDAHRRERRVDAPGAGVRFAAQPRRALRQGRVGARARHARRLAPPEVRR